MEKTQINRHKLEQTLKRVIYFAGTIHLFFNFYSTLIYAEWENSTFFHLLQRIRICFSFPKTIAEKFTWNTEAWTNIRVWLWKVGNLSMNEKKFPWTLQNQIKKFTLDTSTYMFCYFSFENVLWCVVDPKRITKRTQNVMLNIFLKKILTRYKKVDFDGQNDATSKLDHSFELISVKT